MATPSFHHFPDLPYELRLTIWEAAVRPTGPGQRGIHCFSVLDRGSARDLAAKAQAVLFPYEPTGRLQKAAIPTCHHGKPNRSAYLWDAGLWTACKESRRAITAHLKKTRWQRNTLARLVHPPFLVTAPSLPQNDYPERWQLMMHPCEDGIKFDHGSIERILEWSEGFLQLGRQYHVFSGLSLYHHLPDAPVMGNLVFEFDPSWVLALPARSKSGFPSAFVRLCGENSPRGLVARLLESKARGLVSISTIWLIDRGAAQCWPLMQRHAEHAVQRAHFYDCDEEFVDIGAPFRSEPFSASLFVGWLRECSNGHLSVSVWQSGQGDVFDVGDHVRILGCKTKVKPSQVERW